MLDEIGRTSVGVWIMKFMVYGGFEIPKRSNGLGNREFS
jgi:hypothetical protein